MACLKEFDENKAIDDAVDCFRSRGYEATSIRDLVARPALRLLERPGDNNSRQGKK
jgi:TetR/AcrR family transcriptional repressor of nem operon